ncbi:MAG TPA: SDR family oxidoreductase [Acidimicrobiia bacterium]|nr:SDR family oxidoreductase [Acidimicrobiia bacterium]
MIAEADELVDGPGPLLDGRVAVITGGGAGIGAAAAALFARHGAHVVIAEIDEELGRSTVGAITDAGGAASLVPTDVRDQQQVLALRDRVLAEHGRADVLINNVGHWVEVARDFVEQGPELWEALYQVNFFHVLTVTHAFLPSMIERGRGSIVNVSSVEGLRGYPPQPVYGALKAAVVHFTKCLAVQVGVHGVRVNGIGPDVTESVQVPYSTWIPPEQQHLWPLWVPVGRMGVPVDQARVLLFLASDLSAFVTGHTIPTDGGTAAGGGWFRSESRPGRKWTNRPVNP